MMPTARIDDHRSHGRREAEVWLGSLSELRSRLRNIGYPPLSGPPASGAIAPIFTGDMCQPVRAESARRGHRLLRAGRFLRTTHDGKQMIYEPGNKRVIYILWAYHQTGCR